MRTSSKDSFWHSSRKACHRSSAADFVRPLASAVVEVDSRPMFCHVIDLFDRDFSHRIAGAWHQDLACAVVAHGGDQSGGLHRLD
jgi:hypothetical protein